MRLIGKGYLMQDGGKVIALLIDAENVSPKYIKVVLDELSLHGTPAYKRIYGDWTSVEMSSWKKQLLENNLTPIQQFSYTQGKNASDSAMIIDAMDILYSRNCDGFCIVSSDSDFTRLASRLRESRMLVIGMGERKTPAAFKAACDIFKYLDVLKKAQNQQDETSHTDDQKQKTVAKKPSKTIKTQKEKGATEAIETAETMAFADFSDELGGFVPLEEIVGRIQSIIDLESEEDGWMFLGQVGNLLGRSYPDFDTRNYGFSKLHKLIDYTDAFETRYHEIPSGGKNLMVKNKG